MVGLGALAVYAAIKGTSPLEELRSIITGKRPDPLSADPKAKPLESFSGGTIPDTGKKGSGAKLTSTRGVQPHVLAEMQYISNTWGIETQGFAARNIEGTNTLSDHALGLAIDAMSRNDKSIGQAVADYYVANASEKHVKYVIWNRNIWTPGQGWHPYHGVNPHTDHTHISFFPLIRGRVGR
jgi:hypothetical protein